MQAWNGNVSVTSNGMTPSCSETSSSEVKIIIRETATVKAVACVDSRASELSSATYTITPGPVVEVTITLEGITAADMDDENIQRQFLESFADLLGIHVDRMALVSFAGAGRRRLLAVAVVVGIQANSPNSAASLQSSVQNANLSSVAVPPGATVGDVSVTINDPSVTPAPTTGAQVPIPATTPAPLEEVPSSSAEPTSPPAAPTTTPEPSATSNLAIIFAIAVSSVIVVSMVGALSLFYVKRRSSNKKESALEHVPIEAEAEIVQPSGDGASGAEQELRMSSAQLMHDTEPEPEREPQWSDLSNILSTVRFLSSDIVSTYTAPAPMEPHASGSIEAGAALFNPEDYSKTVSVISLDQNEIDER